MAQRKIGQGLIRRDPAYGRTFSLDDEPKGQLPAATGPEAVSREDVGEGATVATPQPVAAEAAVDAAVGRTAEPRPATPSESSGAPAPSRPPAESGKPSSLEDRPAARGKATVTVRVRPKAAQVERIAATAHPPKRVMKAAWRRAVEGYVLRPEYVEPVEGERAGGRDGFYSTTITVDAAALAALVREHDPLGTQGAWWVLRGQLEPLFWVALDGLLDELERKRGR